MGNQALQQSIPEFPGFGINFTNDAVLLRPPHGRDEERGEKGVRGSRGQIPNLWT